MGIAVGWIWWFVCCVVMPLSLTKWLMLWEIVLELTGRLGSWFDCLVGKLVSPDTNEAREPAEYDACCVV
jgi:hypothetical protein